MSDCLTVELISRYLSGESPKSERQEINEHLTKCPSCQKQLETLAARDLDSEKTETNFSVDDKTISFSGEHEHDLKPSTSDTPPSQAQPPSDTDGTSMSIPIIGPVIKGYQILDFVSRGGQAVIYKAIQKATKRTVALKVLQGLFISDRAQYRFEREIDLAAGLKHANIVTIYDSGITESQYYFAMEYIQGKQLDTYVKSQNLARRDIMLLFNKICNLSHAAFLIQFITGGMADAEFMHLGP